MGFHIFVAEETRQKTSNMSGKSRLNFTFLC